MKMPDQAFEDFLFLFQSHRLTDPDGELARAYEARGLSPQQYRWDQLYRIPFSERQFWFDAHRIYDSMNDAHIDTALRRIFPRVWEKKKT